MSTIVTSYKGSEKKKLFCAKNQDLGGVNQMLQAF
jgi:hypothetical protein